MRTILLACALMFVAASCLALPTPRHTEVRVDAYTDPDGVGMWLYWCKGNPVACNDAAFIDTRRFDVGMPSQDPATLQHVMDVIELGSKGTTCFRVTASDAAGNESAFGTLAPGEDGCGWFGIPKPRNQKKK